MTIEGSWDSWGGEDALRRDFLRFTHTHLGACLSSIVCNLLASTVLMFAGDAEADAAWDQRLCILRDHKEEEDSQYVQRP